MGNQPMLEISATPSLPRAKPMISMGVPAGGGGDGKSGKLFVTGDGGDPGDDALMYFLILIFYFCYPSPPPVLSPRSRWGFSGRVGGGGGGKPNFIPAVAGGVQGMSSFGITRHSSRS